MFYILSKAGNPAFCVALRRWPLPSIHGEVSPSSDIVVVFILCDKNITFSPDGLECHLCRSSYQHSAQTCTGSSSRLLLQAQQLLVLMGLAYLSWKSQQSSNVLLKITRALSIMYSTILRLWNLNHMIHYFVGNKFSQMFSFFLIFLWSYQSGTTSLFLHIYKAVSMLTSS